MSEARAASHSGFVMWILEASICRASLLVVVVYDGGGHTQQTEERGKRGLIEGEGNDEKRGNRGNLPVIIDEGKGG